jgi:hypothetical protein
VADAVVIGTKVIQVWKSSRANRCCRRVGFLRGIRPALDDN